MGALVGENHPVILAYGRFLWMHERMQTRLESELDHVHGRRLGFAMMDFHAQLTWRNWWVMLLDSSKRNHVTPPDFCQCLSMIDPHSYFMWLPTVTNAPALLALCATTGVGGQSLASNSVVPSVAAHSGVRDVAAPDTSGVAPA
jgi:hypothetical protein